MYEDQYTEQPEQRDRVREIKQKRWQRRRDWAQSRISAISVLLLGAILLLTALFLLVFPRSTVSEVEKRTLTPFPKFSFASYFAGDFTSGVASHYDDTVPWRDSFKNAGNRFKALFGLRSRENTVTFINKPLEGIENAAPAESKDEETPKEEETAAKPDENEPEAETPVEPEEEEPDQKDFRAEDAEFGLSNGLLVVLQDGHWKCLPLFGGGTGDTYVNALNTLQEKVGSRVKIYSMPAPLSSQFYVPSNAASYSADQSECFDEMAKNFDKRIVHVNVCDELEKHTEEPIYCRTDHHWQSLGAYYALKVFAKAAGVPYPDLEEGYTKGVNEGYVGTMYAFSEDSRILNDPEDFLYYVPKAEYDAFFYDTSFNYHFRDDLFFDVSTASSYLMFLGSDEYVVKINTKVKNGRKLLVIKDSYGNAEIPFLTGSFEQVFVADMRYFQRNLPNFIKAMGVTDVLFSCCSYSVVGGNADNLMNLITQDPDSEIVDHQPEISAQYAAEHPEESGETGGEEQESP